MWGSQETMANQFWESTGARLLSYFSSPFYFSFIWFHLRRPLFCLFVLFYFLFVFWSLENSHFKLLMFEAYSEILNFSFNTLLGWIQYLLLWFSILFGWIISAGNSLRKGVRKMHFLSFYMSVKHEVWQIVSVR